MKINIRHKVFETNSSSTHAIAMPKIKVNYKETFNEMLTIKPGQFGWENELLTTPEEKASYLFTALLELNNKELIDKFKDILFRNNIKFEIINDNDNNYYFDHVNELIGFINIIFSTDEALLTFLFNPNSIVLMGNDNTEIFEKDFNNIILKKLKNLEIKFYYFKGN